MRRSLRTLLLLSLPLPAACMNDELTAPSRDALEAAPSRVVVGGTEVVLETYLWRDFMPPAPSGGQPLIAVLRVATTGGGSIPAGLEVESVHILRGGEVWSARPRQEYESGQDDVLELVARDGPLWGPGIEVDVVVRLRFDGREDLLKARDQPIHRTD